jgi:glutamine synthetase
MVGSSDSCAMPVATINAMTSIVFNEFCEAFANKKFTKQNDFDLDVLKYIADIWKSHKKVVFNGNGYSKDWAREAQSRGLKVVNDMVSAIKVLKTKKAHELYVSTGVMTESELVSRVEVEFENYLKTIRIEVKTMIDIVKKEILPAVLLYKNQIAETIISTRDVYKNDENKATDFSFVESQIFNNLNENIKNLYADLKELEYNYSKCEEIDDMENKACEFRKILVPCMDKLRSSVDTLEMLVDREYWPMPSYGDLIFEVSPI